MIKLTKKQLLELTFDNFPCPTLCNSKGACCKNISIEHAVHFGIEGFINKETRDCINLDKDGRCKIYETRPDCCKINIAFKDLKSNSFPQMTENEYLRDQYVFCKVCDFIGRRYDNEDWNKIEKKGGILSIL